MSTAEIIRVVAVSPSDVQDERDALASVVDELNLHIAKSQDRHVELWRWETDARPGLHKHGPQGRIDDAMKIEDADIVVGIFWTRFGTPTTQATSGTEHELRRAWTAWKHHGHPDVMVYFCDRPYAPGNVDELAQWQRVLAFREELPREQLWWRYTAVVDFERIARTHLTGYLLDRPHGRRPDSSKSEARRALPATGSRRGNAKEAEATWARLTLALSSSPFGSGTGGGAFGIYAPGHDVSRLAYFALYALQHRGQESAGISAADVGGHIMTLRELGLVNQVFDEQKLRALGGDIAVGHVRYSTTGSNSWDNAQPVHRSDRRELALGHNGNLINAVELHTELLEQGVSFRSTSDSEIIAALLAAHEAEHIEDAATEVLPRLHGAFSTVLMTKDTLVAFRDPAGLRPLVLGRLDGTYCVASESCALDIIGAELLRDVAPGEIIWVNATGLHSRQVVKGAREASCIFERIALARPDSRIGGIDVQTDRGRMGEILAREAPAPNADLVIPVPDSGAPAARGYARASGLPQDDGLIKNRYVGRTFIEPGEELRKRGLRLKFNALAEIVGGKSLVVVDDSIVHGNSTRQIVQILRDAGAREVHLRISAPPVRHPCHFGVDIPAPEDLIANERTIGAIAGELGCDSLAFLSLEGAYESIGGESSRHCDACMSGQYPLDPELLELA